MYLRCLCFVSIICYVNAYKVLLMFPFAIKSLSILSEGFVKHLTEAEHEVTYITWFPTKRDYGKNFRQIDVSKSMGAEMGEIDTTALNITTVMTGGIPVNDRASLLEFAYFTAQAALNYEGVRKLIEDTNEKFDVVVADYYETEVFAGLSVLYDCPMIWSYSMSAHWQVLRLIDERTNPAYTSDYLSANMAPLNFRQRLEELWCQIEGMWMKRYTLRAKELSSIYHDRPVSPGKELVHWIEHAVKTGGALHLRSPSLYAKWYQKIYLDFIALILVIQCLIVYVIKMVISKPKKSEKEKKN